MHGMYLTKILFKRFGGRYMYHSGCNAYRQSAGNIVEDNRVVLVKLYDGALRFLSVAKRGVAEKKAHVEEKWRRYH